MTQTSSFPDWHGTTILAVRKNGRTVIAGDGQVSMGPTIVKGAARKVRTLDMVEALKSGKVGGYGADVLDIEPPPADHPLLSAPNCVITPHIGSRTYESVPRQAMRPSSSDFFGPSQNGHSFDLDLVGRSSLLRST